MSEEWFEKGMAVRREVAGAERVDQTMANATDFTMPMQKLVTEVCWGEIWNRPGLDRRSRSILNIGMLAVLGKWDELAGHIKGGVTNGLTKEEVQECLLQVAVYGGMPVGLNAFAVGNRVFEELEA